MSNPIAIGDRLSRRYRPQYQFSKSLFKDGIDPRPSMIEAIDSAIVEGLSDGGWWVVTSAGEHYHVSRFSVDVGDWKRVDREPHLLT
jgi:hypothetical protein